jgi:hypothetical protein
MSQVNKGCAPLVQKKHNRIGEQEILMINPRLNIPASDYEGHMSSPDVGQLSFLAKTFKESMENHDCRTVVLLGCATGNGLEYIRLVFYHMLIRCPRCNRTCSPPQILLLALFWRGAI